MPKTKPIPPGFHTITPHLVVKGARKAIEFYKKAFGAKLLRRQLAPDRKSIVHALIQIGDSRVMLNDEFPDMDCLGPLAIGGTAVTLHLYVPDADKAFERATKAGAKVTMPLAEQFWGDRYGIVTDPFGHLWSIATHTRDLSEVEIAKAAQAPFSTPPTPKKS